MKKILTLCLIMVASFAMIQCNKNITTEDFNLLKNWASVAGKLFTDKSSNPTAGLVFKDAEVVAATTIPAAMPATAVKLDQSQIMTKKLSVKIDASEEKTESDVYQIKSGDTKFLFIIVDKGSDSASAKIAVAAGKEFSTLGDDDSFVTYTERK